MGYLVFTQYKSLMKDRKEKEVWNNEDSKVMVNQCIRDSKEMGVKYPEFTKEYCNCSTKKVQDAMSKQKYNEFLKKSLLEQTDILLPIFQDCLTEYQNKIKEEEAKQN